MELAIRAALKDPVFGLPILLVGIVLLAHTAVYLRSIAQGVTPIIPSLKVFSADLSIVLLAELMLIFSKAIDLFTPDAGTQVGGVDVGPLYSIVGPVLFGGAGVTLAGWLLVRKAQMIRDSVTPPAVTTTTVTGVGLTVGDSTSVTTTTTPEVPKP